MFRLLYKIILLIILLFTEGNLIAQTNILINDSLAVYADFLEINFEYPLDPNLKFTLGGYSIVNDHGLWNNIRATKEGPLGIIEVTVIANTTSFSITDSSSNMATVSIVEKRRGNEYQAYKVVNLLLPNNQEDDPFEYDNQENFAADQIPAGKLESLTAQISITGDSSSSWTFFMVRAIGNRWKPPVDMLLTDGTKTINLFHVSSDALFDYSHPGRYRKNMPAMGVEFFENKKSLCAVQYDSGATYNLDLDPNQTFGCKAWMLHDLDRKTKLVLAATMSILMMLNNQYLSALK